jgi:hypothetical protein
MGDAVSEQFPARPVLTDGSGGATLVVAVVPFDQVRGDRYPTQSGQFCRRCGPGQGTDQDFGELSSVKSVGQGTCLFLATGRQWNIRTAGVAPIPAPSCLAVTDKDNSQFGNDHPDSRALRIPGAQAPQNDYSQPTWYRNCSPEPGMYEIDPALDPM